MSHSWSPQQIDASNISVFTKIPFVDENTLYMSRPREICLTWIPALMPTPLLMHPSKSPIHKLEDYDALCLINFAAISLHKTMKDQTADI